MPTKPLVSVVTPSYNTAAFLEAAVQSVLAQDYAPIEYIVMDGGSTDGSLAILDRYKGKLRCVSEPDGGAADAINRGFALARGSILAWLSADDVYLPGAISAAVRRFASNPGVSVVYGHASWIDEGGRELGPYPTAPFRRELLSQECFICQPACFFRRDALDRVGGLDASLHFPFDYDLWIRMAQTSRFELIPEVLACSRMHRANKTLGSRGRGLRETMNVLKHHYGYVPFRAVLAYYGFLLNGSDQFFEPFQPSVTQCLVSLATGCWHNRTQMLRYSAEWLRGVLHGVLRGRDPNEGRPVYTRYSAEGE
jgi:glycosyltransferase involved in cell wall biosynthesis